MLGGSLRSLSFQIALWQVDAFLIPGRQIIFRGQGAKQVSNTHIDVRIEQHGVVDVPTLLPPRIEDYFFPGAIGMQGSGDPLDRIVEQDGADALPLGEFEPVCRTEKRFVLADWLALVVEDRPTAAHPTRYGINAIDLARLRLDLLLDFAAETIGV